MERPTQANALTRDELQESVEWARTIGLTVPVDAAPIPNAPQTITEALEQASLFGGDALVGPDGRVPMRNCAAQCGERRKHCDNSA